MQKKKISQKLANKQNNPQSTILPNLADIQAILPTHELIIFTKFLKDWVKSVYFFNGLF